MKIPTLLQSFGRAFFRSFVISMLILSWDPNQIWGLPFGIIIGLLSEAEGFCNVNKK